MQRTVLATVVVLALADPTTAKAQCFFVPPGHHGFHGGVVGRPSVRTVGFHGGFFGVPGVRSVGLHGGFFGAPGVRVVGFPGAFRARPFWAVPGWGPVFNPFLSGLVVAPQVVSPPPVIVLGGLDEDEIANNIVPAIARRNDYIVISPRKNIGPAAEERAIPHLDRIVMPMPDRPAFGFDAFARRNELDKLAKPEADPTAEAMRQAREAFVAEQYGRAVEQFDAAIALRPAEPLPYFQKAQAQFAAGQYADAVASIREGMKRSPDWPVSGFKPHELYGPNPGRFEAHIGELRRAVRDNPTEPALEFLFGYELWFGGDRAEAVKQFRSAAKRGKDGAIIDRFLREAEKPR
jgi:hypothetical protein